MADSKITALDNLTSADPANDMIPIVDVSATPPASGNTKRISINNILACSPTATLASATITGDLTVDTSTLKVDSANNRVGIVQATPLYPLHLVGEFGLQEDNPAGTGTKLRFIGDATKYNFRIGKQLNVSNGFEITPSTTLGGATFSNPVYTVTNDGIHTFLNGAGGTRMTLNATGLIRGASSADIISAESTTLTNIGNIGAAHGATTGTYFVAKVGAANGIVELKADARSGAYPPMVFTTGSTQRLKLKETGQLRFVPLASDPTGAESGDVYYNSTSNKLKCYNGTAWNDLF